MTMNLLKKEFNLLKQLIKDTESMSRMHKDSGKDCSPVIRRCSYSCGWRHRSGDD